MARASAPPAVDAAESPGDDASERPGTFGSRVHRLPRRVWVTAAMVVLLVAAVLAYALTRPAGPAPITQRDVDATVQKQLADQAKAQAAAPADASVAYSAIQPSLVLISTKRTSPSGGEAGTGAGVIIKTDGTILTALHVVDGADSIQVSYTDGTTSPATVATQQAANDIATLTPATLPQTLVPAVLGGGVQVGSPVFAVGHPLGLADSLSAGVVSALDRSVNVGGGRTLSHLIQIDAAVNPGNSGGPLLNKAGQVVGIVTGLANPSQQGFFVGIGFAVPIATAGGAAG
ncbi:MAG: trypsin-like peptidase domain-containing protein, partial [Actinomycetota bacterium]|nr:trypsin-like peptidase domain-containing protein [Actinomycetota bacterium]